MKQGGKQKAIFAADHCVGHVFVPIERTNNVAQRIDSPKTVPQNQRLLLTHMNASWTCFIF
jgi:hypothetical protein